MSNATAPAPATVKTDWDSLPLGENLSHLCGTRNQHPHDPITEIYVWDAFNRIPSAKEILSDIKIG